MMAKTLLIAALAAAPAFGQGNGAPTVTFEAPTYFVSGGQFQVELTIEAAPGGSTAAAWWFTPAGFMVDGKPIQRRESDALIELAPNASMTLSYDLGPYLEVDGSFELSFAQGAYDGEPIAVQMFEAVTTRGEGAVDFMEAPADELDQYLVVLETNRGTMVAEFWPDVAPNHVRNYLDLSGSGFYDGTLFHRCIPGFMIQGGDPQTKDPSKSRLWGTGGGPRKLEAEFNERTHDRGVLSAARSQDPDSASSQFFVMHARAPHLDRNYSAFGKVISGLDVVDRIVTSPRGAQDRPNEPQQLVRAVVVKRSE
ncbi:MAG: peptidylprolyl isomerase [Planctomycetota bacterium]|jgi:peptidyl-prolyl cis-trans isomerase B (cyclophilin B)